MCLQFNRLGWRCTEATGGWRHGVGAGSAGLARRRLERAKLGAAWRVPAATRCCCCCCAQQRHPTPGQRLQVKVPDTYGVFKWVVDYRRLGYSYVELTGGR